MRLYPIDNISAIRDNSIVYTDTREDAGHRVDTGNVVNTGYENNVESVVGGGILFY